MAEARDRARSAVEAARALGYPFPLATALETVALVGTASAADPATLATLVATASAIRAAGDRPVPACLSAQVGAMADALPRVEPVSADEAVAAALTLE